MTMTKHEELIRTEYFEWLVKIISQNRFAKEISYKKLLTYLYKTEFKYSILRDSNREEDGKYLRYRFSRHYSKRSDADLYLDGPCNILEMMVALSIRIEENIMDDPTYGDRTSQWFWGMINNMGLGSMDDDNFDEDHVENCINRFLKREYSPNGRGGLFTIRNCKTDLRKVEIWDQLCWYLNTII